MAFGEVILVYLEWGDRNREVALRTAIETTSRIFADIPLRIVIVDNKKICVPFDQAVVLEGDNSGREFSGWDVGIRHIFSRPAAATAVFVFANDTLAVNYGGGFLKMFRPSEIQKRVQAGWTCGYVDEYPSGVEFFGYSLRSWIRTNYFVMPAVTVRKLGRFSFEMDWSKVFGGESLFAREALVSPSLRAYLHEWLTGRVDPGYRLGATWHSAKPWTQENHENLRLKAQMILTELVLSQRIRKVSPGIFDVRTSLFRAGGLYYVAEALRVLRLARRLRAKFWRVGGESTK
ncbi:MAG: hypothetical protein KF767_07215 [Bdellovibrionaceae bacterium]|nr:hypothetical protein [Pseudobdellovibrionaceae bacterium]